ncbi:MAG: RNA-binding protein [Bdellovibrionaceae bacterium]|jgi:RNA recognition motif-containing protein|nr:RNA-binding protein [Pseudobdellovibrionaceae bacterium]
MSAKLYVGNLSYTCDDQSLQDAFSAYGEVVSARVITDRMSGRSKGFGFVEMSDASSAQKAIEAMNGKEFMGRNINVSEARPQEDRPRRSFGGGGAGPRRGGFGGGRGGGHRYDR